jgi:hypothetical protein
MPSLDVGQSDAGIEIDIGFIHVKDLPLRRCPFDEPADIFQNPSTPPHWKA